MIRAMSGSVRASDGLSIDGLLSDMGASMRRDAQAFGATTSRSPVVSPPTARQSQYPKATDPARPALRARRTCVSPVARSYTVVGVGTALPPAGLLIGWAAVAFMARLSS